MNESQPVLHKVISHMPCSVSTEAAGLDNIQAPIILYVNNVRPHLFACSRD